jgi:uncharacterized protein (DUF1499 family)
MSGLARVRPSEWPARKALFLALLTLALVALSPLSYRFGLAAWGAMAMLGAAFVTGFLALRLALGNLAAARNGATGHKGLALLTLMIATAPLVLPSAYGLRALVGGGNALLIHDITTDTDDPPVFVALRAVHRKGADYARGRIAAAQHKAYPDIAPILLDEAPALAFARAQRAAERLGWHIAAARPEEGRIEATATTRIYRFTDDIVIRIRAQGEGTRLDIRSASRIGGGDLGTNARRIRAFAKALKAAP